tara:strand:- start:21 stop:440 length:420 start_codon:yes stop_codon:yes gene_type:complete
MNLVFTSEHLSDLPDIAKKILDYATNYNFFAFYGSIGVGKTTLIKELSLQLGVVDLVSSPTFSIVNEYTTLKDYKIYHFDFYRLNNKEEAFDLGYEQYFNGKDYCFIEWPEKFPNLVNDSIVCIKISLNEAKREIKIVI